MKRKGMSQHEPASNDGENDIWLTPPAILARLGEFALDPCACPEPRPWPTAYQHIALPDDGLTTVWSGRVFLNPPYGKGIGLWLKKMAKHRMGIAMIFARTDTDAWHDWVWSKAHSILFIQNRVDFYLPDGTRKHGSGAPSALVAYSSEDSQVLRECGIRGYIVTAGHRTMEANVCSRRA